MMLSNDDYRRAIRRHNLLVAPVVLLIRVPLLLPFWLVARVGDLADRVGEAIAERLPAFKR